jgi:hypothetical protein
MKFQIGDKVVVKHTNDDAEVVDIINDKMVMLEVRGVKFPAYNDQLEFPYFKMFSEKKLVAPKKEKKYIDDLRVEKKQVQQRVEDGVWLTLIPVMDTDEFGDDVVEELKIHLVNRTKEPLHFQYELSYVGKEGFALNNDIQAFEDFYLHDIPFENLNDSPLFSFEFSLIKHNNKKAPYYEVFQKLKAKQVFQRILALKEKGEATFSYLLFETYPDKAIEEEKIDLGPLSKAGYKFYDVSQLRQHLEQPKDVLDLHIEALEPEHERLSGLQKLELQLRTFEKYYDLALLHYQPSMIVIHGVGSGKLRDEIHELLRMRKEVKSFVNQFHPSYGYGATEIYFHHK